MTGARNGLGFMITDKLQRRLGSLRVSVTDRCNLRCRYCMPEQDYTWLPKESILTFEEITRLARVFVALGVTKLRLTGGEPLLRHDLPGLLRYDQSAYDAFGVAKRLPGMVPGQLTGPTTLMGLGVWTMIATASRARIRRPKCLLSSFNFDSNHH